MAKGCCLLLAGIFTFAYSPTSQFQPEACSIRLFLLLPVARHLRQAKFSETGEFLTMFWVLIVWGRVWGAGVVTFLLQLTEDSYWGLTVSEGKFMTGVALEQ